jgi:Bacterial archaeo-eukaryotic release factor family 11
VLGTPDRLRTFRLPNRLTASAEVADRFYLKPLLRAITFPHEAFVLALSENAVRLVEVFADLPAYTVRVADLPESAADAVRRASVNERSPRGRLQGSKGQKVLLGQYARQVDAALRPVLAGRDVPVILAAVEPLASLFRMVTTLPTLAPQAIQASPDRLSDAELATAARPILDGLYARELETLRDRFEQRRAQGRATRDLAEAARAATFGAVETLLVDIDVFVPGTVDEADGRIALGEGWPEQTYGVVDEIARRALLTGARVLGVRAADLPTDPGAAPLAATLRYPL